MASKFVFSEPHPTVAAGHYTHSGRGGAGNTYKMAADVTASSRPVRTGTTSTSKYSSKMFYSGVGGAGNAHRSSERASISFDEDFDRARVRDSQVAGHVGVGGAGNVFRKAGSAASTSSSRRASEESNSSSTGFWGRLSSSSFARH